VISRLYDFLLDLRDRQRMNISLSRGLAMMQARKVDLSLPGTWEFSGFSQNGEDGILDILRHQLLINNRYFIEIGASDGIENNTTWLAVVEKYNGIMIEGNARLIARAKRMITSCNIGVECRHMFVSAESVSKLVDEVSFSDPDVLSLDIDGNDYYIAKAILENGIRPKIFVVEYNSVYGQIQSRTIEYQKDFSFIKAHPSRLYYGVSIAGWKKFFISHGYRFITVDRNGVNAFFVLPEYFDASFLDGIKGLSFAENYYQYKKFGKQSEEQFALIADQKFVSI